MSKTDFDPDEPRAYGQVWQWENCDPVMLIAPVHSSALLGMIWWALDITHKYPEIREWGLGIDGWERLA